MFVRMTIEHFYDTLISLKYMIKCAFVRTETKSNFRFP